MGSNPTAATKFFFFVTFNVAVGLYILKLSHFFFPCFFISLSTDALLSLFFSKKAGGWGWGGEKRGAFEIKEAYYKVAPLKDFESLMF